MSQLKSECPNPHLTAFNTMMESCLTEYLWTNHPAPCARAELKILKGKKTMRWDTETSRQLLLATLAAHEVNVGV